MDQTEALNSINSDLIRGHIDTIILKALQAGDRYGYDIIKEIEHKSDGQYVIKQPTLYSCLKRLEVQGFVKSYWGSKSIGGRKKYFTLTDMGRELFIRNKTDWDFSRTVIDKLISDDDYLASADNPPQKAAIQRTISFQQDEPEQNDVTEDDDEFEEPEILDIELLEPSDDEDDLDEEPVAPTPIEDEEDDDEPEELLEVRPAEEEVEEPEILDIELLEPSDDEDNSDEEPVAPAPIEDEDDEEQEELLEVRPAEEEIEEPEILDIELLEPSDDEDDLDEEPVTPTPIEDEEDDDEPEELLEVRPAEEEIEEPEILDIELLEPSDDEDDLDEEPVAPTPIEDEEDEQEDLLEIQPAEEENDEEQEVAQSVDATPTEDDLPLSAAELNIIDNSESDEDEGTDVVNRFYDEDRRESYRNNVDNTEYVPSQSDLIDVDNYFSDIEEDESEEEVASSVEEPIQQPAKPDYQPPKRYVREQPQPQENKTIFYSYKDTTVSSIDDRASIIDKEYRSVINKMISDNIIISEPPKPQQQPRPERQPITHEREPEPPKQQQYVDETGESVELRTHSDKTIKAYNSKHFYYCNQMRLLQYGILFGVMLLEIILCFYFIEVSHNKMNISSASLGVYIASIVLAALFPITAFFMASTDYGKRKRINYNGKSTALFSIIVTILLWLIIFFANIYGGILIGNINNYLSTLILPMVLATNVIVNSIIFHMLYTSGKYNVEE